MIPPKSKTSLLVGCGDGFIGEAPIIIVEVDYLRLMPPCLIKAYL